VLKSDAGESGDLSAVVSSPAVQRKGVLMGLADFAFPIGLPIIELIFGIFGKLQRTRRQEHLR